MIRRLGSLLVAVLAFLQTQAATYYVDASRPDDSGNGQTWGAAKKTIQSAVNLTVAGDDVLVTNGVYDTGATITPGYSVSNRVVVTKDVVIHSVNGSTVTVIEGSGTNFYGTTSAVRCVFMSKGRLEGFTLRAGTTYELSQSANSFDNSGGGVYVESSAINVGLSNCIIQSCKANGGGGSYYGTLNNCILTGNFADWHGGGSYYGTLNNCTLARNVADFYGGGSYNGTLNNCTLCGNAAVNDGGGSYSGTLNNCVVWGNTEKISGATDNYYSHSGTFCYSCTTPLPSGIGNISSDPLFVNAATGDYRLASGSPCLDIGSDVYVVSATDILGNLRIQGVHVDMGAYEFPIASTPVFIPITGTVFTNTAVIALTCSTAGASIRYTLDGTVPTQTSEPYTDVITLSNNTTVKAKAFKSGLADSGVATATYTVCAATPTFDPPTGTVFTNSLTVTLSCSTDGATIRYTLDGSTPTPASPVYTETLSLVKSATVRAKAFKSGMADSTTATAIFRTDILYVDAARPDDSGDGSSWTTAKKTIQSAVNASIAGDTVLVTNGVYNTGTTVTPGYSVSNRVAVTKAITIRSVNGADVTIIEGAGFATYGTPSAVRCVYMNNGVLDGFTLRNGATFDNLQSASAYNHGGGGVCMVGATVGTEVRNSIVQNCKAYSGGAAYQSKLTNCTISQNWAYMNGGGLYTGTLLDCVISANSAGGSGGGSYQSVLLRCNLTGNTASTSGGGSYEGILTECTLSGNVATSNGGGSYYGTISRCEYSGNTAASGGGSYYGTLNNCVFSYNTATSGGGAYYGTLDNCTLSANTATSGGGSYNGTLNNCVVWGNIMPNGSTNNYSSGTFRHSCTTPFITGLGNIASDPLFTCEDDLRLRSGSPCLNSGNNAYGTGSLDVLGNPRIQDGTVDMGAYEGGLPVVAMPAFAPASGTVFTNSLVVTLTNSMADATIRYTLDGTDPTTNSQAFTSSFVLYQSTTVKAKAYKSGMAESLIATAFYTLQTVATPVFTPPSGTSGTNSLELAIASDTVGATIRYTTNGTEPSAGSAEYTGVLVLTVSATIKAKAFRSGMADSATATAAYTVSVFTPAIAPDSGRSYTNAVVVNLTCSTAGAAIRFTTNGTDPTTSSTLYTNAVTLTQSTTVKARAFKSEMVDSAIVSASYLVIQTVATPIFSPVSGSVRTNSLLAALTCATSGATIRYTLDGSEPYAGSAIYAGIITLTQSATVKAKAFKTGMADSAAASADYTVIQTVATPVITPATGTTFTNSLVITLTCATVDAAIRYTLDGSLPTSGSALYSKPVKISRDTVIRACAFKTGMLVSRVVDASYFKELTLPEALDVTNCVFTAGGNAKWDGRNLLTAHDGVDAAQSGVITNSQVSWMETTVNETGTLSFWWKTSCEDDPDADNWDFLRLLVDGSERCRIDGISDWQLVTCTFGDGIHVIRWEYSKDETLSDGEDRAWVDQLSFSSGLPTSTTTTPVPVPYTWLDQYPVLLGLAGGDYEAMALADVDGDGHAAWQEYVTGSILTNRESVFTTLIAISNGLPWLTWTPDLGAARAYSVAGRTNLTETTWGYTNSASRFFRVSVMLP